MADPVTLHEMSPRDGLQNEAAIVATADKIRLVNLLSGCGLTRIEVTSFVSPKWVPQMADAAAVMAGITRRPGVRYAALVPNLQGYDRARAAGADEVAVFASASEGFSRHNINCSVAESLDRFRPVLQAAAADGVAVRGYVSCVTDCPYDGPVAPAAVAGVAAALFAMGCCQISLGDTTGMATPDRIARMLQAVLAQVPARHLAGHYHDTQGRALENIAVSLTLGLRSFDCSAGGLGGCPYAPGARGNVATEAVLALLQAQGFSTGIDPGRLAAAATFAQGLRRPA